MRTKSAVRFLLLHALWIALVAAGIGGDKNPAAPSPPPNTPTPPNTQPIVSLNSLAIGGTLPPDAGRRTYTARIEEGRHVGFPEDLVVMLNGADFEWGEAGFTGARDGTAVRFQITDEYDARLAVVENSGTMQMGYRGTATGVVRDKTIVATFDGRVRLSAGGATVTECTAPDHRLEFTR